jgi:hypothetical protein
MVEPFSQTRMVTGFANPHEYASLEATKIKGLREEVHWRRVKHAFPGIGCLKNRVNSGLKIF